MKKASPSTVFKIKVGGIVLSLVIVVTVCFLTILATRENDKVIAVCRLKNNIKADRIITSGDIEEYNMYYKEFKNAGTIKLSDGSSLSTIVTWENRDLVVGKRFASSYLYKGSNLMWSMTTSQQNKRHSYLYSMDGELLNIKMDASDFGEIVVPGDVLNIRATYTETLYNLPTEEQYLLSADSASQGITREVTEFLFQEVVVLDMLNSADESIYDIYYDFMKQSKSKQTELLANPDFLSSLKSKTILLQVTGDEAVRYSKIASKGATYLITLLPRTSNNAIIDTIDTVQNALESTN